MLVQSNIDKLFKLIGSGKQIIKEGESRYKGMAESISKKKLDSPFQDEALAISKYQTYTKTNSMSFSSNIPQTKKPHIYVKLLRTGRDSNPRPPP